MAILQSTAGGESVRVKLGESPDAAPNWRLVEVNPRSVVIAGPDGQRTLELRVFDGAGGQAPTVTASAPEVAAPGAPARCPAAAATQGARCANGCSRGRCRPTG